MKTIKIIFVFLLLSVSAQNQKYLVITWAKNPTARQVHSLSYDLYTVRNDFYTNLKNWVEEHGSKDLRLKVKMTESNFSKNLKQQTFTPVQIDSMMRGFVPPEPKNPYNWIGGTEASDRLARGFKDTIDEDGLELGEFDMPIPDY